MIIEDGGDWLADQVSWRGRDIVRLSGERIGIFKEEMNCGMCNPSN
jgi:hypothetical protein